MANSPITDVTFDSTACCWNWNSPRMPGRPIPDEIVERICADDDPAASSATRTAWTPARISRTSTGCGTRTRPGTRRHLQVLHRPLRGRAAPHASGHGRAAGGFEGPRYGVWGLTNWSHETFHLAFEKYPRLEQLLQGTVVSGVEKMHKPNADIYELALTRFGLTAERCVFFDDTAKNIVGANEVGIHGILFENALQARESLAELGVRL